MKNSEIVRILENAAASYEILGENRFKIIAYQQAAENISRLNIDVETIWKEGKLKQISGVGASLSQHLEELFAKGKSKHFEQILKKMPPGMFDLLQLNRVGTKTAYKIALELLKMKFPSSMSTFSKLERAIEAHRICEMEGFGEKKEAEIRESLQDFRRQKSKAKRVSIAFASEAAERLLAYLKADKNIIKIDILGSLRRKTETVGDIDIAAAAKNSQQTIEHFCKYPNLVKVIEKGEQGASIMVEADMQADLRVSKIEEYGSMLQYFTGSKSHNIKLREYALKKGLSLSEYGIKKKSKPRSKLHQFAKEEDFYRFLGLEWIPPEMREDRGEIDLAKENKLPKLVEPGDIKGDLHIHSDYEFPSSHDYGEDSLSNILELAQELNYEYIGLSDHNPKQSDLTGEDVVSILKKRKQHFEDLLYGKKSLQNKFTVKKVFIMIEADIKPDGNLAIPDRGFNYLDAVIASIHSSFQMPKEAMTKRILKALSYPKVRIFGHPTGRMINERDGVDADWDKIFSLCAEKNIALEINSWPQRLDLPDHLVWQARKTGVKFAINTDSHRKGEMGLIKYGVFVAKRGWLRQSDIINTLPYDKFEGWLMRD